MKHLFVSVLSIFLLAGCGELDPREPGLLVPRTVDQDPSLPSITVNNTQLHAESFGNPADPMVVVLHGGPGADYRYLLNCKAIAENGYYVVFYDQRGSGLSRRESKSSYSREVMLDDLNAVITHYRSSPQQKIILLGHSWGAILATAYINQYPNAIYRAILAEPGGFTWKDIKDYVGRCQRYGLTSETLNDVAYVDQFITGKESEQEMLDYKFSLLTTTDAAGDSPIGDGDHVPFWRWGALVMEALFERGERENPDWTGNLHSFNTKVLFVYSERNRAYGLAHAQHVSSAYPSIQLVRIDGAGHDMLSFPTGWNSFFSIALTYLNEE